MELPDNLRELFAKELLLTTVNGPDEIAVIMKVLEKSIRTAVFAEPEQPETREIATPREVKLLHDQRVFFNTTEIPYAEAQARAATWEDAAKFCDDVANARRPPHDGVEACEQLRDDFREFAKKVSEFKGRQIETRKTNTHAVVENLRMWVVANERVLAADPMTAKVDDLQMRLEVARELLDIIDAGAIDTEQFFNNLADRLMKNTLWLAGLSNEDGRRRLLELFQEEYEVIK